MFLATVSALVCLVCSNRVLRNYDDDDDNDLLEPNSQLQSKTSVAKLYTTNENSNISD